MYMMSPEYMMKYLLDSLDKLRSLKYIEITCDDRSPGDDTMGRTLPGNPIIVIFPDGQGPRDLTETLIHEMTHDAMGTLDTDDIYWDDGSYWSETPKGVLETYPQHGIPGWTFQDYMTHADTITPFLLVFNTYADAADLDTAQSDYEEFHRWLDEYFSWPLRGTMDPKLIIEGYDNAD